MSLYHLQKLLYRLNRDPETRRRFETEREALLAEFRLDDDELAAIREADIGRLYVMGAHPQLLMHYAALCGYEWNAYLEAMREGERRYKGAAE